MTDFCQILSTLQVRPRVLLFAKPLAVSSARRFLQRQAAEVKVAETSLGAFEIALSYRPHALVADINAEDPGGGVVAADFIRWLDPSVRFLLFASDLASPGCALARARGFGHWSFHDGEFEDRIREDLPLCVLGAEGDRSPEELNRVDPASLCSRVFHPGSVPLGRSLAAIERRYCELAMLAESKVSLAAPLLSKDRKTFRKLQKKHGLVDMEADSEIDVKR